MSSSTCEAQLSKDSDSSNDGLVTISQGSPKLIEVDYSRKNNAKSICIPTGFEPSCSNTSVKRKCSTDKTRAAEGFSSKHSKLTCTEQIFVEIGTDDTDASEGDSIQSTDVNLEGKMDDDEENAINSSVISSDNSDSESADLQEPPENAMRDDKRSRCTSKASFDEVALFSSESSMSSRSSESDIFLRDTPSPWRFTANNPRNVVLAPDSDESESNSDDQYDAGSPDRAPEVLKKTLPSQKFSFPREVMNRQFYDDIRRKRAIKFENKVYASRKMVQKLELYKKLEKHHGSVNCISFNDTGEVLSSGSDDRHVSLWDWANNKNLAYFNTGHIGTLYQAKFLPHRGDTHMVTCGADSQIRMCLLDQSGLRSSSLIGKHTKTVHKLALQKQMSNTFLSAGEDGVVYSIDVRESNNSSQKLLKVSCTPSRPQVSVFLYSIDCNPLKNHEFIVCGNDKDIRLYDQRKISPGKSYPVVMFCPTDLKLSEEPYQRLTQQRMKKYMKSVTSAVYNHNGTEILASYNDNDIYLFDSSTFEEVHHYDGHRNVASIKGVNFYGPHSEYIVSGSDCGYIYLWDKNSEAIVQWMRGDEHIVNCLEPHPSFPILATSGIDLDVKMWMPTGKGDIDVKELPEFRKLVEWARSIFHYQLHGLCYGVWSSPDEGHESDSSLD